MLVNVWTPGKVLDLDAVLEGPAALISLRGSAGISTCSRFTGLVLRPAEHPRNTASCSIERLNVLVQCCVSARCSRL